MYDVLETNARAECVCGMRVRNVDDVADVHEGAGGIKHVSDAYECAGTRGGGCIREAEAEK